MGVTSIQMFKLKCEGDARCRDNREENIMKLIFRRSYAAASDEEVMF